MALEFFFFCVFFSPSAERRRGKREKGRERGLFSNFSFYIFPLFTLAYLFVFTKKFVFNKSYLKRNKFRQNGFSNQI